MTLDRRLAALATNVRKKSTKSLGARALDVKSSDGQSLQADGGERPNRLDRRGMSRNLCMVCPPESQASKRGLFDALGLRAGAVIYCGFLTCLNYLRCD